MASNCSFLPLRQNNEFELWKMLFDSFAQLHPTPRRGRKTKCGVSAPSPDCRTAASASFSRKTDDRSALLPTVSPHRHGCIRPRRQTPTPGAPAFPPGTADRPSPRRLPAEPTKKAQAGRMTRLRRYSPKRPPERRCVCRKSLLKNTCRADPAPRPSAARQA